MAVTDGFLFIQDFYAYILKNIDDKLTLCLIPMLLHLFEPYYFFKSTPDLSFFKDHVNILLSVRDLSISYKLFYHSNIPLKFSMYYLVASLFSIILYK